MKKMIVPNEILLAEADDLLSKGIEVVLMTKGNSMLPFIRGEKDSVNLKRFGAVEVGDIVLARIAPQRYVLHRIFAIDGDAVTLMGDGNLAGTEHCALADVKAKVTHVVNADGIAHEIDNGWRRRAARIWFRLRPLRRYLLAIYKRL